MTNLINLAASLMDGSDDVILDADGHPLNSEYLRGQAELICEAYGLPMDEKPVVVREILSRADLDVIELFTWADERHHVARCIRCQRTFAAHEQNTHWKDHA